MKRGRHLPTDAVAVAAVLAADATLAAADTAWLERGYARTSCRVWRCRNGTFTARMVWRNRDNVVATITYVAQGLVIP
ncbi:hypothetical protein KHC23_22960 [Ancylobacter dichloromethanicus]|uniref:Uncharacterized protein n=1 Tax=Ancylobacter dichloromethanicus TaxID=518825 RepID=A0A9W6JEV3_9HYPH|nr:hypothetical protein [Ancylobacter dichloromethanicus]MBS7556495.1 hypothetical protein [Ancylobacter dichloromethanicus]GLK74714.1 hypothetical protein GCM10017643_48330 [Ancylobacter dichloromethanicus]